MPYKKPGTVDRTRDFERRLTNLERLNRGQIDVGSLSSSGQVHVTNGAGDTVVNAGANGDQSGLQTFRPDGTSLMSSMGSGDGGKAYTAIFDKDGVLVFADNPDYGGLRRPYMPLGMLVDAAPPGTFPTPPTSSTFVTMQSGVCVRNNPAVQWDALVSSDDPATTGFVQLVDDLGNVIGAPVAVTPDAVTPITLGPVAWPAATWTPGDIKTLSVQANLTGGAGSITVRTIGLLGIGDPP